MSNYVTIQEVREQAGFQYKIIGEAVGTGNGTNQTFTLDYKPIVDRTGSGTPVTVADVSIYVSGSPVAVGTVVSASGQIVLATAPASGSPVTADYDWSNLEDNIINNYLTEAHSYINSKIGKVYTLPLSETPKVLELIEKKLAAGLLLDKEYSVGGDETEDTRGRRWIKWAEDRLKEIMNGDFELRDSSGNPLTQISSIGFDGWPDNTTADAEEDDSGGDINFRISDKF